MALRVAFFDMDKTLVRVNTGEVYAKWRYRRGESGLGELARVAWWSVQYTLGLVDAAAVSAFAARALRGRDEQAFADECREWYGAMVRPHLTDLARREVARRRAEGMTPVILTGSTPYIAQPLADDLEIEHVVASRLCVADGRFTGEVESPLCFGEGKLARARQWAAPRDVDFRTSAFYTDSASDLPMLEQVGEPRIVNPDPRLRALAKKRAWPIESW